VEDIVPLLQSEDPMEFATRCFDEFIALLYELLEGNFSNIARASQVCSWVI
jgi:hypothetical protein